MYYMIDMESLPDDLYREVTKYILVSDSGFYLYINKESLDFFRAHTILTEDYEVINIEKLKEILLIKHLRS